MEGTLSKGFDKAVWGAALMMVLVAPAAALAHGGGRHGSGKLDSVLSEHGSSGTDRAVIVTTKAGAKSSVRARAERRGMKTLKVHAIVNAVTLRASDQDLAALVNDPDVLSVSVDADVAASASSKNDGGTTTTNNNNTYYNYEVVSELKKALAIGNWFTGSTVTIAVIDSGIAPTADFSGRILGNFDFTNGRGGALIAPADEYGHGTHVAGLVGSSGAVSAGAYAGVAPGIRLLSLKVLDKKGAGKTSDVIDALQFAVANKDRYGIRIINLSLGHPIFESAVTDPLVQAVEAAVRAGIVVVAAAGNYGINNATGLPGYAGITSPGNAPSAITVGAATTGNTIERTDDRVANYSSRGPSWYDGYAKPDIVAPGTGLLSSESAGSTLETLYPSLVVPSGTGKLMKLSGSSMATGVVSGLVAVMIETHDYAAYQRYQSSGRLKKLSVYVPPPALTPNAIKAMLQYSATPLRDDAGNRLNALTQGAGEVDGLGAVTLAYMADTSAGVGSAWMAPVQPYTLFGTTTEAWSQQIVWGTRLVSGAGLMDVQQAAWDVSVPWGAGELANIVWGTMVEDGESIVWGTMLDVDNIVWGGSVFEGENIVWGTAALPDWGPNIVWGTALLGAFDGENIVWGTALDGENIVWGTMLDFDNIVWGTLDDENIVWGTSNKVTSLGLVGGVL